MMRFAAEASRHMQGAEIVEYHHAAKLDAPSGTAKRTADLMEGDVPVHSVRLPGLVADQDVILGDVAQTLTIRHVTTDRTSFMPGVLIAVAAPSPGCPTGSTVGRRAPAIWPADGSRARTCSSRSPTTRPSATASGCAARWTRGPRSPRASAARGPPGDVSREPPPGAAAQRGSVYVRDGDIVYVCLEDRPRGELVVVTLWQEGEDPAVARRFTDALKRDDLRDERRRRPRAGT